MFSKIGKAFMFAAEKQQEAVNEKYAKQEQEEIKAAPAPVFDSTTSMTPAEEAYNPLAGARLVRSRYTVIS